MTTYTTPHFVPFCMPNFFHNNLSIYWYIWIYKKWHSYTLPFPPNGPKFHQGWLRRWWGEDPQIGGKLELPLYQCAFHHLNHLLYQFLNLATTFCTNLPPYALALIAMDHRQWSLVSQNRTWSPNRAHRLSIVYCAHKVKTRPERWCFF